MKNLANDAALLCMCFSARAICLKEKAGCIEILENPLVLPSA